MEEKGELDHYIGVATTETAHHFSQLDVPACTWAVFEAVGPFPQNTTGNMGAHLCGVVPIIWL